MLTTLKRAALAAAALVLLAGSALAEPQKADKAAPPCPKVEFTAADVVRAQRQQAQCSLMPIPSQLDRLHLL